MNPKYQSGDHVLLGDNVRLAAGDCGVVVAVIEIDLFSQLYPRKEWAYLGSGVLVESERAGLIHYPTPFSSDVPLASRTSENQKK